MNSSTQFKKGMIPWNKGLRKETNSKIKSMSENKKGAKNGMWKGGITKSPTGYVLIKNLTHPNKNSEGYVQEHRLVMEKHLGRYLTKEEVVHHINEVRDDNLIKNLMLFPNQAAHGRHHYPRQAFVCTKCFKEDIKIVRGFCKKCYCKNWRLEFKAKINSRQ